MLFSLILGVKGLKKTTESTTIYLYSLDRYVLPNHTVWLFKLNSKINVGKRSLT